MIFIAVPPRDVIDVFAAFEHMHCELVVVYGLADARMRTRHQRRQQRQRAP